MIGFQAPSLNCLEATEICCVESEPIEAYASVVSSISSWTDAGIITTSSYKANVSADMPSGLRLKRGLT